MKKFFSLPLYRDALRRTRVFGIIVAVLVLFNTFSEPLVLLFTSLIFREESLPITVVSPSQLLSPLYIVLLLAVPFVLTSYHFLFKRAPSDYYLSLPYTRQSLFFSTFCADVTWLGGISAVSAVLRMITYAISPSTIFSFGFTLLGLLIALISITELMALAALSASVCGTGFSAFLIFLALCFDFRIVMTVFARRLNKLIPILTIDEGFFSHLTFRGFLPASFASSGGIMSLLLSGENNFFDPVSVIWAVCVIILSLSLGCAAFLRRPGQTAGAATASPIYQHILRSLYALPLICAAAGAFVALVLPSSSVVDISTPIVLLCVSLGIYVLVELITTGKVKRFGRMMVVFACVVGVGAGFALSLIAARTTVLSTGVERDQIHSVSFERQHSIYDQTYEDLVTAGIGFDDPQVLDTVIVAYNRSLSVCKTNPERYTYQADYASPGDPMGTQFVSYDVSIGLKGGKTLYRNLLFTQEEIQVIMTAGFLSEKYADARLSLPPAQSIMYVTADNLTESKDDLWKVFCEEYEMLSQEEKCMVKRWNAQSTDTAFSIQVVGILDYRIYFSDYDVPYTMQRTVNAYLKALNEQKIETPSGEVTSSDLVRDTMSSMIEAGNYSSYDYIGLTFELRTSDGRRFMAGVPDSDGSYPDMSDKEREMITSVLEALQNGQTHGFTSSSNTLFVHLWFYQEKENTEAAALFVIDDDAAQDLLAWMQR